MKKLFLLLALLGIVATGCSKDEVDKGNDNKTEQPNDNEGGNQVEDYVFVTDSQNNYSVVANGGEIVVTVATSIEYSVAIPAEAQSWISVAITRAVHMEKLTFIITKNEANAERSAVVKLIGGDKSELQSITFIQQGKKAEVENPDDTTEVIKFQDTNTKLICTSHWDINDDGELSYNEAAAVTDLGTAFNESPIIVFSELKYFTGISGISDSAFKDCFSLIKITLPEQITSIGNSAFNGCNNLKNIDIPNGVTSIGSSAFYNCSSLTSVTIGDSVTTIGDYAFYNCSSLTSVTTIGEEAFYCCSSLTSVTIGDSVTTIGDYAFGYCSSLTRITIPDSVTTIGDYAFRGCSSLTSVTIPNSVTKIGDYAFRGCSSLTSVTIPDSVTTIGNYAFYYCSSLTSVTIGDSVTTIGEDAFGYCSSLTSVTIGDSVTTIGERAFEYCRSLTSVTIGDSVTTIGDYAFRYCDSLTSVTIPDSVTEIGVGAFNSCSSLTSVYCKAITPPGLGSFAFYYNASGRKIYVPMESVEAYRSASDWSEYNIVGYNF